MTIIAAILTVLLVLIFVVPLFIKKDYHISQFVSVRKPKTEVFAYVKELGNQVYYNKWVMADPNVKRVTSGTDGTVGFRNAWDSEVKSVGKGEQEITKVVPGERVDSTVRFEKPFKNVAQIEMTTETESSGVTRLGWSMHGRNKYPMNIMNLFIPGMLSRDMAESLGNLKAIIENRD